MDNDKMPTVEEEFLDALDVLWRQHGNDDPGYKAMLPFVKQIAELQAEANEQARLNGMGAEREARLMAQVAELQAEVNDLARRLCLSAEHEIATNRHVYQLEIERIALTKDAARIDWIGAHVKAVILHGDTAPRLLWADTELPRYPRDVRSGIDAAMSEEER